jgi:pyrimidine-specific ribonucleoside hydrolase
LIPTDKARCPVIIDSDLSFDDYVALLFLLQHPAIDIRAITVVNGVVHVKPGISNVGRLLKLANRRDIPFAGGPDTPLSGQRAFPDGWRKILDYGIRLFLPWTSLPVPLLSAAELICQQCMSSERPVTFVELGPMANLALALRARPEIASHIERIVISGGAFNVKGTIHAEIPENPNEVAEWNHYIDVEAAQQIYSSGIPITLVPLDATHVDGARPMVFSRDTVKNLRKAARSRTARMMTQLIYYWGLSVPQYNAVPVWDAAVAALVADPTIGADWRDLAIRIETEPEALAGQTVIESGKPVNARVCFSGDQARFEDAYLSVVRESER